MCYQKVYLFILGIVCVYLRSKMTTFSDLPFELRLYILRLARKMQFRSKIRRFESISKKAVERKMTICGADWYCNVENKYHIVLEVKHHHHVGPMLNIRTWDGSETNVRKSRHRLWRRLPTGGFERI